MSEIKLLPCPFCGGEAILRGHCVFENAWMVECQNKECKCKTEFAPKEEAIEIWNTRKPMQEILERLKSLYLVNPYPNEFSNGRDYANNRAIEIVKEVGGMND